MSVTHIPSTLRRQIQRRAKRRCEYCLLGEEHGYFSFEADHVIAEKHDGKTVLKNLAWACFDCNRFKGSDISSIDPRTGRIVPLFNPRLQMWGRHFQTVAGKIIPLTAAGRATVRLLKLNLPARIEVRAALAKAYLYP